MKSIIVKHGKKFSMFILISVLFCSVFGFYYDLRVVRECNVLAPHGISVLQLSGVSEFVNVEGISISQSQAAIIRQVFSRTGSRGTICTNIIDIILVPIISITRLAFLNLHRETFQKNHMFITDFIHNKDGKKS